MTHSKKDVLDNLGLSSHSEEEQIDTLLGLQDLIFEATLIRLVEQMNEKTRVAFEKLLEQDTSDEDMEAFIKKHVPHADKAVKEAIAELKNDILAVTGS